jgi:hypothetical protein
MYRRIDDFLGATEDRRCDPEFTVHSSQFKGVTPSSQFDNRAVARALSSLSERAQIPRFVEIGTYIADPDVQPFQ